MVSIKKPPTYDQIRFNGLRLRSPNDIKVRTVRLRKEMPINTRYNNNMPPKRLSRIFLKLFEFI
jgi:hypothetical protein